MAKNLLLFSAKIDFGWKCLAETRTVFSRSGKVNKTALEKLIKNFNEKEKILNTGPIKSFDTKFFDFSFVKDLSFEDGAATLTEFTAKIIISAIKAANRYKEKN